MEIELIRAIGFDWDGTLVDSMGTKSRCFAESVLRYYPIIDKKRKQIEDFYLSTRGNPRIYQLEALQKKFGLNDLSFEQTQQWSDLFTALYIDRDIPLFEDAEATIEGLMGRGYGVFLCSSVPQMDLDSTLTHYPIRDNFSIRLGTRDNGIFRKGKPHLTFVSENLGISLDKIAFVGDGPDDVRGANEAGCFSIGKTDSRIPDVMEEFKKSSPNLIIENLGELLDIFKPRSSQ